VRIAVSGSHSTGKSTLIAAFLARCPAYLHEAEAYESLADDVDVPAEGPTAEGLQLLLEHTISTLALHGPGTSVVFERSPVDYLAYAAASGRSWGRRPVETFLETFIPRVRASLPSLELIAFVPVSPDGALSRPGESSRFRRRVDEALRRALVDDDYDLFGEPGSPRVVELPSSPERQLAELTRLGSMVP
jgi:hypothetical protein